MKIYKVIEAWQIEQFPGWEFERIFTQQVIDRQSVTEPIVINNYTNSAYKDVVNVLNREYVMISKESEAASREADLDLKLLNATKVMKDLQADLETRTLQLKVVQDEVAKKEKQRCDASNALIEERDRYAKLETAAGKLRGDIAKVMREIGAERWREIVEEKS